MRNNLTMWVVIKEMEEREDYSLPSNSGGPKEMMSVQTPGRMPSPDSNHQNLDLDNKCLLIKPPCCGSFL